LDRKRLKNIFVFCCDPLLAKENQWSPGLAGQSKTSPAIGNPRKSQQILLNASGIFCIFFIKPSETFSISYKIFQILALGLLGSGSADSRPAGLAGRARGAGGVSKILKKQRK